MNEHKSNIDEFEQELIEIGRTQRLLMLKNFVLLFLILGIVIFIVSLPPTFWLIPSSTTNKAINPMKDPNLILIKENIAASDNIPYRDLDKLIQKKNLKGSENYYIIPLAKYSLSGRIIAKNKFFFDKNDFDKIALIDYGIVWGDLVKDEYFFKLSSNSRKYLNNARGLMVFFSEKYRPQYGHMQNYVNDHFSHTHIIPANNRIMRVLNYARIGQNIKIDGYLVDIFDGNKRRIVMTSISNTDTNESSRGGGACEVMYVVRVQVGNKIFE